RQRVCELCHQGRVQERGPLLACGAPGTGGTPALPISHRPWPPTVNRGESGGRDMFVHAEEFDNRQEARARYLQITGRLRAERDRDLGCYNLLYEGMRPVVAILAPQAPPADVLAGR